MNRPTRQRSRLLAGLITCALMVGLTLTGTIVPAQAANGTLSGTVTEAGTGAPVGGVSVWAFCWQVAGTDPGEVCGQTQTAENGTYTLSVAPGVYKVSFAHYPHHANQYYGGGKELEDVDSRQASVTSGGSATGIDAALVPLRSVSGTVKGTGTPVGGINVTAYQLSAGPSPTWEPRDSAVTAPDGTYALHVPDGTYRVGFMDTRGPYRTIFYGGAATVEAADDVVVTGDVVDIDADMARNYPITGGVTVDGVDMPGVIVTAFRANASAPSGWESVKYTETGLDGTYALYLDDGTYRIQFQTWQGRFPTQYYPSASTIAQATDVVVAGSEVPGISAAIISGDVDTGPAIRGKITLADGGAPVEGIYVTAWRFDVEFGSWVQVRVRPTMADGSYALHVPEGTYRIGVRDVVNRYQEAFYGGGAAVEDAADVVQPSEGVAGVDIEVVENLSISGVVTADPVPGAPPGPPPTDVTAWRWDVTTLEWVHAGGAFIRPDGHYDLYAPEGTYRIEFSTFASGYRQPHFYDGSDNIGEAVDVVLDGDDVTGIDAHLVVAPADEPPPTWLSARTLSDAGSDAWDPRVAVGSRDTALAVWSHRGAGGSRVRVSVRRTSGSWDQSAFISPAGQDAVDPRVAVGADGTFVVAWRRWDGSHYRVEARSRSAAGTWSSPVTLSGPGADAWDPQVAVGHDRAAVVVWRSSDGTGSEVHASTLSSDESWSAPTVLSGDREAWDPQAAVAADGSGVVAWSRSDGPHFRVQAVRLSRAGLWSARTNLSAPGRDSEDPQVAVAPRGAATVVWRSPDGTDERIQAAVRTPGGGWSDPATLSTSGQDAHDPQVAMDPGGTVTAVWARWDGSSDRIQAASRVPGETWSAPVTLSGGGQDATAPQVTAGPHGRATVVWRQVDGSEERVLAAIGNTDWTTWSAPTTLTSGLEPAYAPRVATGPNGTVAVVWERRIDGTDRIQGAVRFDPGGPEHCHISGVDLNIVFGVPEQFVFGTCQTVDERARWRPLMTWFMNSAFEYVPPGFVPAGATPLEDLLAKLRSVKVVVDPGTSTAKTVVFTPAEALRADVTADVLDPAWPPLPVAASLPRMSRLPEGEHTIRVIWRLDAQHCDGLGSVEAENCLPAGNVRLWTRVITVGSGS